MAPIAAAGAHHTARWDKLQVVTRELAEGSYLREFYQAVLSIENNCFAVVGGRWSVVGGR